MVAILPPRQTIRLTIAALLIMLSCFCNLRAQAHNMEEDKGTTPVTVTGSGIPLERVLKSIEKQTGLRFNYRTELLNVQERVTVDFRNRPLDEILNTLLKPKGFSWRYIGTAITLQQNAASPAKPVTYAEMDTLINFSGKIVTNEGKPLPGATVMIKGTQQGVSSGTDGGFSLKTPANATLVVSYTGFNRQEVRPSGRNNVMVQLEQAMNYLSETIAVAYGTSTVRSNTGAVSTVKAEQIETLPNRSVDKSLQGLVPGLLITNGTGQPGGGVSNMVLRGVSSGTDGLSGSTARNPLIIIDGMPVTQDYMQNTLIATATPVSNPMAQLNPNDIANISVLKDAAAIALYGSQASNGVIIITTKRGRHDKSSITISHQTDLSYNPKRSVDILNRDEYLKLIYETYRNTNPTLYTDDYITKELYKKFPYIKNGNDSSFYPESNWTDAIFQQGAPTNTTNISFSGAGEKNNYYLNLEHSNQSGIVKSTGYERTSVRLNLDSRPTRFLKISSSTSLSYNKQNITNTNEASNYFGALATLSPLAPIRDTAGRYIYNYSYGLIALANPVAAAELNKNKITSYRGLSTLKAEVNFLKMFTFSSNLGIDYMLAENYEKSDPRMRHPETGAFGRIVESTTRRANLISTTTLAFKKRIGQNHSLDAIIGQEAQIITQKIVFLSAIGTINTKTYYDQLNSPGYTINSSFVSNTRRTLLSQLGQVQYGFLNKYYLSSSLRRDGASSFGAKQQFGNYWSFGASWIVSDEKFMDATSEYINGLRLRGSYGLAGNAANMREAIRYDRLIESTINGQNALLPAPDPANSRIKWEDTYSWNVGVDATLLKNKLSLTLDAYTKNTKNLLHTVNLPTHSGFQYTYDNIGDLKNTGLEITVNAEAIRTKNFQWNISGNWSMNKNVLTKAYVPLESINGTELGNEVGRTYNSFYMPVWMGVNPDDGLPQWRDSSGKPTSTYGRAAKMIVGQPLPKGFATLTQSFRYKGINLSFTLYHQYGNKLYNTLESTFNQDGANVFNNQSTSAANYWRKPGDIVPNPLRKMNSTTLSTAASTRYLIDGGYLRLQQILLSYSLPSSFLKKMRLTGARLYTQAFNVKTWSFARANTPDNANVAGRIANAYPIATSYSFGININL